MGECIEQIESANRAVITEIWETMIPEMRVNILRSGGYEFGHLCTSKEQINHVVYHYIHGSFSANLYTCSNCATQFALDPEALRVEPGLSLRPIDIRVPPGTKASYEDPATKPAMHAYVEYCSPVTRGGGWKSDAP